MTKARTLFAGTKDGPSAVPCLGHKYLGICFCFSQASVCKQIDALLAKWVGRICSVAIGLTRTLGLGLGINHEERPQLLPFRLLSNIPISESCASFRAAASPTRLGGSFTSRIAVEGNEGNCGGTYSAFSSTCRSSKRQHRNPNAPATPGRDGQRCDRRLRLDRP